MLRSCFRPISRILRPSSLRQHTIQPRKLQQSWLLDQLQNLGNNNMGEG